MHVGDGSLASLTPDEILLLVGVSFASLLLILAAFIILTITLLFIVRYLPMVYIYIQQPFHTIYRRRRSEVVLNMITVHNYGMAGDDDESNTDSLQERHTLLVEETKVTDNTIPVTSNQYEPFTVSSKKQVSKLYYLTVILDSDLERDPQDQVAKSTVEETTDNKTPFKIEPYELKVTTGNEQGKKIRDGTQYDHCYGMAADDNSDTDSLQEQHTLLVEETKFTDNTRSVTSIQYEPFTVPSKEQVSKL